MPVTAHPQPETLVLATTAGLETPLSFEVLHQRPKGTPRGAIVLLHEAFGITPHIQRVMADYAAQGYWVAAPVLFAYATRAPQGEVLPQNKNGLERGRDLIQATPPVVVIGIIEATARWLQQQGLKTAALGYCWGGSCAYAAGTALPEVIQVVISYYGGQLGQLAEQGQPRGPTLVHLAEHDRYIPVQPTVAAFTAHHPAAEVYVYDADHGFNRNDGVTFHPEFAEVAREKTLEFLDKHLK